MSYQVLARNRAPHARVAGVAPVVAGHEVLAFGYDPAAAAGAAPFRPHPRLVQLAKVSRIGAGSPISRQVARGTDVPVRIFLIPFFSPRDLCDSLIDAPLSSGESVSSNRSSRSTAALSSSRFR